MRLPLLMLALALLLNATGARASAKDCDHANAALRAFLQSRGLGCKADADCVAFPFAGSCDAVAIPKKTLAGLAKSAGKTLADKAQAVCPPSPECEPTPPPRCMHGTCN